MRTRVRGALGAASLALALLAPGLVGAVGVGAPARADDHPGTPHDPGEVIDRAGRLLSPAATATDRRFDLTLTMRDLFVARPRLGFFDGLRADLLLARPTDGLQDPGGDGYKGKSDEICGRRLCVHYARHGEDAPRSQDWVRRTLHVLSAVWSFEVDDFGMRRPPSDGHRGGDGRFDVYLADLGNRGLFGYCTPESRVPGQRFAASGYCVLDDDFARSQYGARPLSSLRVTAAHEFFHAIQFGYDFREDPWLLESTAMWMEDQFADASNDNRRYLQYGSVRHPGVSLDLFSNTRYTQYGNWAFWQYLSEKYGRGIVRHVWARADALGDAPDDYSVQALRRVLRHRDGLTAALTGYATANLDPADHYEEGAHWPRARPSGTLRLAGGDRATRTLQVDHLAAADLRIVPGSGAAGRHALLSISVDAPDRRSAAVSVEVRRRSGHVLRRTVDLDRHGRGAAVLAFGAARTGSVVVTAVNGSTRYRCHRATTFACSGKPLDQDRGFRITASVRRP
ncbi:MAG TPA: MXAN_6640 family putative metalloprotease [Nocardioides sp.]|nr:MXAN_6640 family putative metalloprotease [Nocardioides sp.]